MRVKRHVFFPIKVALPGNVFDRDAVKHNVRVLKCAALALGLRVSVNTCIVHVQALYDLMKVSAPRPLMQT